MIKTIQRVSYVLKMFFVTMSIWDFKDWVMFWFGRKQDVDLHGFKFYVRKGVRAKISDLSMLFEVLVSKQYDQCKIEKGDTVVDIGAHIGGFSMLASSAKRVLSFEPHPSTYSYLEKNVRKKNVQLFNVAVGKESKKDILYVSDTNMAECSLVKKSSKQIAVRTITLRDIFKKIKHCNVLKLDCEGSEYDILFSSSELLPKIDKIIMEYHVPKYFNIKEYSVKDLVEYLKKHGFKVVVEKKKYYQGIIYAEK